MTWSVSINPGHCAFPTNPKPEEKGLREKYSPPAKHTVGSSFTPISDTRRADSALSAEFISGEAPMLGQEA